MGKNKHKKKRTVDVDEKEEEYKSAPHSFVFHRGKVGKNVKELAMDARLIMEPFTAKKLQVRKKNVLKDFVNVAGLLHVSHFIFYTKTDVSVNMKMCRLPRGPTLTFKVHKYCLTKDLVSSMKKPNLAQLQYLHHPLLVMNNFTGDEKHVQLMSSMFQNMFPSINVHKVNLNDVRRCLMVNYNPDTKLVDIRHYNIKVVPVGIGRGVKKLSQAKIPNLAKYSDISEYVNRAGYSSESEVEVDGPASEVILPQEIRSRGNIQSTKSAIRLTELGPRLTVQLVKIEEGICEGDVMFHEFIHKTEEELAQQKKLRKKKKALKEARKNKQAENVRQKKDKLEENKQRSLAGIKRKQAEEGVEDPELGVEDSDDDDVEYYKQEVGTMPDSDAFLSSGTKRKHKDNVPDRPKKKMRVENGEKSRKPYSNSNETGKHGAGGNKRFNRKDSGGDSWKSKGKAGSAGDSWKSKGKAGSGGDSWKSKGKAGSGGDSWKSKGKAGSGGDSWKSKGKAGSGGDSWKSKGKAGEKEKLSKAKRREGMTIQQQIVEKKKIKLKLKEKKMKHKNK